MRRLLLIAVACAGTSAAHATAQVCRVVDPVYEALPERPKTDDPWKAPYPDPAPNAEVQRLLAEAKAASDRGDDREAAKKMQDAVRAMDRWSKQELKRLHNSGMAVARQGGPRAPKEVPDILHIGRAASTLGVETGAITMATDVLGAYYNTRMKQLRETGMQTARLANVHPPDQFREALYLDQQLQTLAPNTSAGSGMELARELYTTWGDARLTKLEQEGAAAIESGIKEIPRQVGEALTIARDIQTLGGPSEATLSDRAEKVMRSVLEDWLSKRSETLRTSGEAVATAAPDLPPDEFAELLGLLREVQKFEADASRVRAATSGVLVKWVDAHTQKLAPPGHAAARAGAERHPEQVAQLVTFAKTLDCLEGDYAAVVEPVRTKARSIGEENLEAFRDKLDCPAKPEELTTLRELADGLEAYGWGPYDKKGPACGWRGTIISRTEKTTHRDTVAHPSGQPIHYKMEGSEWTEIRWEVDGDIAHVTVTGNGNLLVHNIGLVPMCGFQETREESKRSIDAKPGSVPFKVSPISGKDYLFETESPPYTERTDTHTKRADSQACPLKGGESNETSTFDVRGHPVVMRSEGDQADSGIAGKPKLTLRGEMVVPIDLNYSKQVTKITWDLERAPARVR